MVIQWRRTTTQSSEISIMDPSESVPEVARFIANNGISDAQIVGLAQRLGLKRIPPMSPTEDAIAGWLRRYGPIWVNGTTHIVVIAGIRPDKLYIHDPWPVNHGKTEWRSISGWYSGFIDQNTNSGIFMHCPSLPAWARVPASKQALYQVRKGDNLSSIAQRFYGKTIRWRKIYDANKATIGTNPNRIMPGQRLLIPLK
jgi:nucleoid-associated protein YgaU